jgi:predicted phosphodiesterase
MNGLKVVGDTHGKYKSHAKICWRAEKEGMCTLQLGDYGFSYKPLRHFGLSPEYHKLFGGNHDNYEKLKDCPNNLGDFGETTLGGVNFFFVRGAFSIDKAQRTQGKDWWPEEELTMGQCYKALEQYKQARPRIMITHDCPNVMRDWFYNKGVCDFKIDTRTGQILQAMYEEYQPEYWIFGHWHVDVKIKIGQTIFVCLNELSEMTL